MTLRGDYGSGTANGALNSSTVGANVTHSADIRDVTPGKNKGNRATIAFGQQFQTAASPTYDGGSWHIAFMTEIPYYAVRAVIRNEESAGYTLSAMTFAPSTNVTTPISTGTNVAVTFGGASSKAIPARFNTAYTTDNTHPNDAGQAVLRPLWESAIQQLMPRLA